MLPVEAKRTSQIILPAPFMADYSAQPLLPLISLPTLADSQEDHRPCATPRHWAVEAGGPAEVRMA
jgi:hypothetical protein